MTDYFDEAISPPVALTDAIREDVRQLEKWIERLACITFRSTAAQVVDAITPTAVESEAFGRLAERFPETHADVAECLAQTATLMESSGANEPDMVTHYANMAASIELHLRVFPSLVRRIDLAQTSRCSGPESAYEVSVAAMHEANLSFKRDRAWQSWCFLNEAIKSGDVQYASEAINLWKSFPSEMTSVIEDTLSLAMSDYQYRPEVFERHYPHGDNRPRRKHLRNWQALGSRTARECWPTAARAAIEALLAEWETAFALIKQADSQFSVSIGKRLVLDDLQLRTSLLLFQQLEALPESGSEWPYSMFPLLAELSPQERGEYNELIVQGAKRLNEIDAECEEHRNELRSKQMTAIELFDSDFPDEDGPDANLDNFGPKMLTNSPTFDPDRVIPPTLIGPAVTSHGLVIPKGKVFWEFDVEQRADKPAKAPWHHPPGTEIPDEYRHLSVNSGRDYVEGTQAAVGATLRRLDWQDKQERALQGYIVKAALREPPNVFVIKESNEHYQVYFRDIQTLRNALVTCQASSLTRRAG